MPKEKVVVMVAVFAHRQSLKTRPICNIPRDEARWWVESGGATSHNRGRSIILTQIISTELIGTSSRMGPSAIIGNAAGSKFFTEILKRWRFGFVEPPMAA